MVDVARRMMRRSLKYRGRGIFLLQSLHVSHRASVPRHGTATYIGTMDIDEGILNIYRAHSCDGGGRRRFKSVRAHASRKLAGGKVGGWPTKTTPQQGSFQS